MTSLRAAIKIKVIQRMYSRKQIRSRFCLVQFMGLLSDLRINNGTIAVTKDYSDCAYQEFKERLCIN